MRAGVMCLDLHPVHAQMLAVGLHDGSVLVLSIHKAALQPLYSTAGQPGKHADAGVTPQAHCTLLTAWSAIIHCATDESFRAGPAARFLDCRRMPNGQARQQG